MTENEIILKKITDLGVKNLKNPTADDMKLILDTCLKSKTLDMNSFEIFCKTMDSSVETIFDGFKAFSNDEVIITGSAMNILRRGISVLEKELTREMSNQDRINLRQQIFDLLMEVPKESDASRNHRGSAHTKLIISLAVVGVVIIAALAIIFGGGGDD